MEGAEVTKKEPQIRVQFTRLVESIRILESGILDIGERLAPLMIDPGPPTTGDGVNAKEPELSPFASEIREARWMVGSLNERIRNFTGRLEI